MVETKALHKALAALGSSIAERTLKNGLRVRLVPSAAVPMVSLFLFYRVGSRNECPGVTGMTHLFEHMMFNGSAKYGPGKFDTVLESNGGSSNAYTSTDVTVYHEDFMAGALDTVLDLEADRMHALQLSPAKLDTERQVVIEERRLRVDNEISGLMDEELSTLLWRAHPYRWPVIGWMGDIENIKAEDCVAYYRAHYCPNNALLYLAGDLDVERTFGLVEKRFGRLKPSSVPTPPVDSEPDQKGERRAVVYHAAQAPSLLVGWRGCAVTDASTLALDVLQHILSGGQSSRLVRELVFQSEQAVSVHVDWGWRIDPGPFVISMQLRPGQDAKAAESALDAALTKVKRDGVSAREVAKAVNAITHQFYRELATNGGRAHALGTFETFFGGWRIGLQLAEAYRAIRPEDVQAAGVRYLDERRKCVVSLSPLAAA